MQDLPSIHFWGPWTSAERHELGKAIQDFESRHHLTRPTPPSGRPWIAIIHDLPNNQRYCFASRIGITEAFTGTSTTGLANTIRNTDFSDLT